MNLVKLWAKPSSKFVFFINSCRSRLWSLDLETIWSNFQIWSGNSSFTIVELHLHLIQCDPWLILVTWSFRSCNCVWLVVFVVIYFKFSCTLNSMVIRCLWKVLNHDHAEFWLIFCLCVQSNRLLDLWRNQSNRLLWDRMVLFAYFWDCFGFSCLFFPLLVVLALNCIIETNFSSISMDFGYV